MDIEVKEKKISIGDQFDILIDGQQTYAAVSQLFRLLAVVDLFKVDDTRPRLTVNKLWYWWEPKYDISTYDNNVLQFRTISVWKNHYQCQRGPDLFDIYGHTGRKFSVYKNDEQIAWWDKNAVAIFNGNTYSITADRDCDQELIIAFCLIIHDCSHDDDNAAVSIDLGNVGPEDKKFDAAWRAK